MSAFGRLVVADYEQLYGTREESARRRRLLMAVRLVINPSLHANVLIRAALCGPRVLFNGWRHVLLAKHSIDVAPDCVIGPGLTLPHPFGIAVSPGSRIGERASIYHNVCIGAPSHTALAGANVGDDVVLHTNAVVMAGASLGDRVVVGANTIVDADVPGDSVVKLGEVRRRRRRATPAQADDDA